MSGPADRAAVVLCGGTSRRMGRPKALLPFGAESLLVRVLRLCGEACGERVVVAAAGQELPPLPADVRVVRDARPGQGPLEGLAAGLAACRAPAALVTPCDVPFLSPRVVALLFHRLGEADACLPVAEGLAQPIPAVYRASLAPAASALVAAGRRRVGLLSEGCPRVEVAEEELRRADPALASFRDCGTPEEYAAALREAGFGA